MDDVFDVFTGTGNLLRSPSFANSLLALVFAFPLVDWLLRDVVPRYVHFLSFLGPLWINAVFAFLALVYLTRYIDGNESVPIPFARMMGLFMALVAAGIFVNMGDIFVGLQGWRGTCEYMLAVFLVANAVPSRRVFLALLWEAVAVAVLVAVYGLYQYKAGIPVPYQWVGVGSSLPTRAFSIVQSPNVLGDYMALMIPVTIGLFFQERLLWTRVILLVGILILAGALLVTFSRGAWLSLALAALFTTYFLDRRLFGALLVLGAAALFMPPVLHRLENLVSWRYLQESELNGRIYRWNLAFYHMAVAPLTGAGTGHFGGAVAANYLHGVYADNYYAKTLGEEGIPGLIGFAGLMFLAVRSAFLAWRRLRERSDYWLGAGLFAGILVVALHNGVENIFATPFLNTYFWSLVALAVIWPRLAGEGR
ncbi:MAG: O-antigen ligase family protein [Peptococcaceae bacterium]|nr:O-antigen ligase family protein [Peptococcaceae bacterium]